MNVHSSLGAEAITNLWDGKHTSVWSKYSLGRAVWLPPLILLFSNNNTVLCTQWTYVTLCKYIAEGANVWKLLSVTGFSHDILNDESRRNCWDYIKWSLASEFHPNQFWLPLVHLGDKRDRGRNYSLKFWLMRGLTITCILLLWWKFPPVLKAHIGFSKWICPSNESYHGILLFPYIIYQSPH